MAQIEAERWLERIADTPGMGVYPENVLGPLWSENAKPS
ncbi:hypothetical protein UFOVP1122_22 [uncultured Caudovirales phage]|uniref:Uncharacterized protein n=1 Tax=uncultured Caudovirales phage TaxID=2100421 RepID=A0A6J5QV98_9CAUD|nr:hypothetical protein UFOVP1122_22 [uncultured Caudovirales phage]